MPNQILTRPRHPGFHELITHAESLVAEDKGEEVLAISFGSSPSLFSARTLLNKFNKGNRNDLRPDAKRLSCPILVIVGGAEPRLFHGYGREIARAAGSSGTYKLVKDANHFYSRHTSEMVDLIDR